jgi:ComF family protein
MLVQALARARHLLLNELLPERCGICGRYGSFLCGDCVALLPLAAKPRCIRCWQPASGLCPRCDEYGSDCTAVRAPYRYDAGARRLVTEVKYGGMFSLARPMAVLLGSYWVSTGISADIVMSVPLHTRRERQRGFNQSALLAQPLAETLGLPYDGGTLKRCRSTPPQARLAHEDARRSNVRGAFVCKEDGVTGVRVLLIDDVTTTGATLGACAVALFQQGAAAVFGLAFTVAG